MQCLIYGIVIIIIIIIVLVVVVVIIIINFDKCVIGKICLLQERREWRDARLIALSKLKKEMKEAEKSGK